MTAEIYRFSEIYVFFSRVFMTSLASEKCPYSELFLSVFSRIRISRIQSECGKIRTRITPKTDTVYAYVPTCFCDCRSEEVLASVEVIFISDFDSDKNTTIVFNRSFHSFHVKAYVRTSSCLCNKYFNWSFELAVF